MARVAKKVVRLSSCEHTDDLHATHQFHVLEDMMNVAKVKKKEVFAICVTGVYRSGKSFLLNLLHLYLEYLSQHKGNDDDWENQKDKVIKGVNWSSGQTAVTMGISMWMYPKLIHGKGVLLIDCQGTGDMDRSTPTLDHLILFFGLQLSDVLILNVRNQLTSDDMGRLELCTTFADDPGKEKIFEHLVCLVRDWAGEENPHSMEEMLKNATNKHVQDCYRGIRKAFKSTEVTGLEEPGRKFGTKKEDHDISIGDVYPEFILGVKSFFQRLIQRLRSSKTKFTGEELLNQFKILGQRPIEVIRTQQDEARDMAVRKAFEDAKCLWEEKLGQLLASEDMRSKGQHHVKSAIAAVFDDALKSFLNSSKVASYASSAQREEYKTRLGKIHIMFVEEFDRSEKERAAERKREQQRKQEYDREKFAQAQALHHEVVKEKNKANEEFEEMQLVQLHAMRSLRLLREQSASAVSKRQSSISQDSGNEEVEEQTVRFKALWDFTATDEDELNFSEGDIILMLREIDENWSYGTLNGVEGFFPQAFCERL